MVKEGQVSTRDRATGFIEAQSGSWSPRAISVNKVQDG
jgi:hypothetical protein